MNKNLDIWGVEALVLLKYNRSLIDLVEILRETLQLQDFTIDTDQDPPHEEFGMGEALGFEYWLNKSSILSGYNFEFSFQTENSSQEIVYGKMHDISLWLAKLISIYNIDCCVYNLKEEIHVEFVKGKIKTA